MCAAIMPGALAISHKAHVGPSSLQTEQFFLVWFFASFFSSNLFGVDDLGFEEFFCLLIGQLCLRKNAYDVTMSLVTMSRQLTQAFV